MSEPTAARGGTRTGRVLVRASQVLLGLLVAAAVAFVIWGSTPLGPAPTALDALQSDAAVTVTEYDWGFGFAPAAATSGTGFVLYPGGHVDHRSYAPLAREIASRGHTVAIVRVPLSLAILRTGAAATPMEQLDEVDTWAVGGHSLGGVAAAGFAGSDRRVAGLVLLASYPVDDLSAAELETADVTASLDGVLDTAAWAEARPLLPARTTEVVIEGGNHAGFGDYGPQPGDDAASIPTIEQHRLTADAVDGVLRRLSPR